jgi:hypothetical protein
VDKRTLERELEVAFGGTERARRVVARQARDLADAGLIEADLDFELTVEAVVENMADAPEDHALIERWNWWLSSLELSHGGYNRFRVRPDAVEEPE